MASQACSAAVNGGLGKTLPKHSRGRAEEPTEAFVLDGEAVVLGIDGVSDFEGTYSCKHDQEVQLGALSGFTVCAPAPLRGSKPRAKSLR